MIVTDLKFMTINSRIPESEFILLTGDQASKLDPAKDGGRKFKIDGTVMQIDPTEHGDEQVAVSLISYSALSQLSVYSPIRNHLIDFLRF